MRKRVKKQKRAPGKKTARRAMKAKKPDPVLAPVRGAERRQVGHVKLEVGRAGAARVKRMIYPPGFHWAKDMKAAVGTDLCMHAHVGFLVQGKMVVEYGDGCREEYEAPAPMVIPPGHDGWVVGDETAVLVQYDCGPGTCERLGLPTEHAH